MKKRARLTEENDPLTSADKVLAGYERVGNSKGQQGNKSTSQKDGGSIVRKSTFQIDEAVIQQLDTFHLQLQLKLGKANAPYKEVIVEEAIARLLASEDQTELIAALQDRQKSRQ